MNPAPESGAEASRFSPERRAEFNREPRQLREQPIPRILFVYLVYFAVHLICVTTSLTTFQKPGERFSFSRPPSRCYGATRGRRPG